jgi:YD repeat-containing protein
MSQLVTQLPPPPIRPKQGNPLPYILLALAAIAVLVLGLEWRIAHCHGAEEALQRIRTDARVRAEFGDDVSVWFGVGGGFADQGWLYGWLSGKHLHGHAIANLQGVAGRWELAGLEVVDESEGHIISLAKPESPIEPDQLKAPGSIYLVALGNTATGDAADLTSFFANELGIPIKTLPAMPLPAEAYDASRKQWVAELLVQAMEAKYSEVAADPDAKIIGVLEDDQYIRDFGWDFTFSYRYQSKYSVISPFRLDPAFRRFSPNAAIRMERLRKVAMKAVAFLYLGLNESQNPQSVDAFEGSTEEIDRMGSVYLASDLRTRNTNDDMDGEPCLTFYSINLVGPALSKPIIPCWQRQDENENTQYQIDLLQGRFQLTRNDLFRGGPVPLLLQRMFFSNHLDERVRAFGKSSWQNLDDTVWSTDPSSIQVISINGVKFHRLTPGTGFSPAARYQAGPQNGVFSNALLSWENGGWRVETNRQEIWRYLDCGPNTPVQCYYLGTRSQAEDAVEVKRDRATGHIQQVVQKTNPDLPSVAAHDHVLTPTYDGNKIVEITDSDGQTAHYHYDAQEFLTDTDADGHRVHYDYDNAHRITGVVEDGMELGIHYDAEGRPFRVDFPHGSGYSIKYSENNIEVVGPGGKYRVIALGSVFRVVEQK